MPKMIDADKLQDWIDRTEFAFYGRYGETGEGVVKALGMLKEQLDAGNLAPTPPVQPDTPKRMGRYFIVSVKDEGFHLQSDEGEEVHYILIDINGRMEGYSDDLKEIESIYGRVTRIPGEVIKDE